jgi:hypothetical protein
MVSDLRYYVMVVCCIAGCNQGGDWQQKYADCKTLASVMSKEPSPFIKAPECERIPQLCSNTPQSTECMNELKKYYRK